jgi:hypothetical protein
MLMAMTDRTFGRTAIQKARTFQNISHPHEGAVPAYQQDKNTSWRNRVGE